MNGAQYEIKEINMENLDLRKYNIFKGLLPNEINMLHQDMVFNIYRRGAVVYKEGVRLNGLFFVGKGILKLYKVGLGAREQIIRFAKEGDLIAYRSIISEELSCTTAEVISDAVLGYITEEKFTSFFRNNPEFAMSLMKLTCRELNESNKYLINIAQKTVRERLAEVLLKLMETFELEADKSLKVALTREEIANVVGTATESVIRLLSEFKADKLIDVSGRKIKLLNIPKLVKIGNLYN